MERVIFGLPVWAYLCIGVLGAIEYVLPRVGNPRARSVGEALANILLIPLGRFPILGPLLRALGTPGAPPPPAGGAGGKLMLALALGGLLSLQGCATAGGQAYKDCQMGKLPATLESVIATVVSIAANPASTVAELEALGKQIGPSQLACAVQAVHAWLSSTPHAMGASEVYTDAAHDQRVHAMGVLSLYLERHRPAACREVTGRSYAAMPLVDLGR